MVSLNLWLLKNFLPGNLPVTSFQQLWGLDERKEYQSLLFGGRIFEVLESLNGLGLWWYLQRWYEQMKLMVHSTSRWSYPCNSSLLGLWLEPLLYNLWLTPVDFSVDLWEKCKKKKIYYLIVVRNKETWKWRASLSLFIRSYSRNLQVLDNNPQ